LTGKEREAETGLDYFGSRYFRTRIEGKIGTREYLAQDKKLPDKLADLEIDRP